MLKFKTLIYLLLSFLLNLNIVGQTDVVDSLKKVLKNSTHDTSRCRAIASLVEVAPDGEWEAFNQQLIDLVELNLKKHSSDKSLTKIFKKYKAFSLVNSGIILKMHGKTNEALSCFENSLKIQEEIDYKEGIAYALGGIGVIYQELGKNDKALSYHLKASEMQREIKDDKGLAYTLIYIGQLYNSSGNVKKALDVYNESLKINERIDNKQGMAFAINDIGVLYQSQDETANALECFLKSYKLQEELGDKIGQATSLHNVADVYLSKRDYNKALEYFNKALKLNEEINNQHGIALALANIGRTYEHFNNYLEAQNYYSKSLSIYTELNEASGIIDGNTGLGRAYFRSGDYSKAVPYAEKAFKLAKELGFPIQISTVAKLLTEIYKKQNNKAKAFDMLELYLLMRDSVSNEQTKRASIKNQLNYEYDKKVVADSLKAAEEKKIRQLKSEQEKKQRYFLYAGLVLTLVFGGFMFNRFRITQKQKKVIEEQKHLVEEKQKEIIDSIHYAKRIQQSLMPNEKYIEKTIDKLKK